MAEPNRNVLVADADIDHMTALVKTLIKWKHVMGPACPDDVAQTIFRLSIVMLRLQAQSNAR